MKATRCWVTGLALLLGATGCGTGYYEERLDETLLLLRQGRFRLGAAPIPVNQDDQSAEEGEAPADAAPEADPPAAETAPEPAPADEAAAE